MTADLALVPAARLRQGDTVALLAPASWAEDDWLQANVAQLESWGLRVSVGRHVRDRIGYLAGSDADRADDLNAAISNPEVRAVIALLGGCGSLRLLETINVRALREDPKPLVGFSDITALHRVWRGAGVASLHGCIVGHHADDVRRQLFGEPPAAIAVEDGGFTAPLTTSGRASGVLFGGNLEMLARSVGVLPFDRHGHVLLLEANRAAGLGMVDRALTQLLLSGSFDGITGIALGRFDGFEDYQDRGWNVLNVLHDRLDNLGVPILAGLPLGHGDNPRTVPLGVECQLDADSRVLTVASALS